MTTDEIAALLAYAYPVIWASAAAGIALMVGAYLKTRKPHTVSGAMLFVCGLLYFVAVGRLAFTRPYTPDLVETRFALAAFAVSILIHLVVAGWEEWHGQHGGHGNGKEH